MANKSKKTNETPAATREDVVAKIQNLNVAVEEMKSDSVDTLKMIAICGVIVLVGIAFLSGRRRALRPKTLVSIIKTR